MCLEQEASQLEGEVSAQGFVWPQENMPPHTTYTPLQTMPICHALTVLMMIGIPWRGPGGVYTHPSHLPSATLTGSPMPPHDRLHGLSFTLTSRRLLSL